MLHHLPESSPLPPLSDPSSKVRTPPMTSYPTERPTGVTVLALLNFLSAGLSMLLVARVLLIPRETLLQGYELVPGFPQTFTFISTTGAVFVGLAGTAICLPLAIGLWKLRQWARIMALVVYIGGVLVTLCTNFTIPITGSTLLSMAIGVGAAIYLLQPEADRAFGELPLDRV